MDRRTNSSRILVSNASFVNNHFWNCYESESGEVVVDAVAATEDYLDNYFSHELNSPKAKWDQLFHDAVRCYIPPAGKEVMCEKLFADGGPVFDYPTFNPNYKMNPKYQYFYAIAPKTKESRWFDSLIK